LANEPSVEVGFYHCTRAPATEVALRLAAKAHAAGQRLLILVASAQLEPLDRALWVEDRDSFLPHAIAGGAHDAEQPILLADQLPAEPPNGARLLMLLEQGLPPEFAGFTRLLNLFDDNSPAHHRARTDWKAIGSRSGLDRSYWRQTPRGGWEKI